VSPEATARDARLAAGEDYGNPEPEWPGIDWRALLRRVRLPGAEVNCVELGEGVPVLFVHGISGCWQNWLETLPHLARSHRVIALDLPGFGGSPMPAWPIDIAAYGRLLHELCEELGVGRATVVGNSMGGLVATEALTAAPGRFERLVLVSSAGIINTWSPKPRATATAWAWKHFGPGFRRRERAIISRPRLRQAVFGPFIHFPHRLREDLLFEQMDNGLRKADGFGEALQATIATDIRGRLGAIEVPTLVVGGLSDRVIPVAGAVSLHRRIPHSRLEIFERTGHVPQLERPARFNALLEEFLGG
jgi:pimeloyl-ACP methyl ester carboxylesterase